MSTAKIDSTQPRIKNLPSSTERFRSTFTKLRQHRIRRSVRAARLGLPFCARCETNPVEQEICCFEAKERFKACSDCISHRAAEYQKADFEFEIREVDDGFRADDPPCPSCNGSGRGYRNRQCVCCHGSGLLTEQVRAMLCGDNPPKEIASNH